MRFKFLIMVLSCSCFLLAENKQIREQIEQIIQAVDSQQREGELENTQFVVAIFQQILKRDPSWMELATTTRLMSHQKCCGDSAHHTTAMKRSQLLGLLLAQKEKVSVLEYSHLQKNLSLLQNLDFTSKVSWNPTPQEEKTTPLQRKKLTVKQHNQDYQLYYGYLHCHTSFSDGQGTPDEAYQMAKEQAKLDFFAVTDHGELLMLWPWEKRWEKIKESAQQYHEDGKFVALHGFEWSSPILGHINVIHSEEYTNCVSTLLVEDIYQWISERPNVVSRFNHPGYTDVLGVEFEHFKVYPQVVDQMVGIEMHNGSEGIKYYFNQKGYEGKFHHMDEANQKGWQLGTVGGQDNHSKDWGLKNDYVVGVWATSLTREGILDAYRGRRTFATEDRNLSLSFKMDEAEMGSCLTQGTKTIEIQLLDGDRENFTRVDVYKSGVLLKSYETKSSAPKFTLSVETAPQEYYYVLASQEDGDLALSSPIWIVDNN